MILENNKIKFFVLGGLFLAAFLIWLALWQASPAALRVIFFDVGQGAAVFIEAPNKNQVLIDGGPGSQILNKLGQTMPFFDHYIDLLILTHPDSDHLNGLVEVLKKYQVGQVLEPCFEDASASYQEWLRLIQQKKITRVCAFAGQKVVIADNLELDVLHPFQEVKNISAKNTNEVSVAAKLIYGQGKILLTGDTEKPAEYQMLGLGTDLISQILQVAHHGSKTSTTQEFLNAVKPEIVVIQVGKNNRYGHPHQEVLERLKGVKIYRTDLDGDVEFLCGLEKCVIEK